MISPLELQKAGVGKTLSEARLALGKLGYTIRVMKEDGQHKIGTCDFRMDRINVTVENGKVTEVGSIG